MVKKIKTKKKIVRPKNIFIPGHEITSSSGDSPNITLTPEASLDRATGSHLLSSNPTQAPPIGEKSEEQDKIAESIPALIDKYVLSKYPFFIPAILAFFLIASVISYIFIQDNGAGKLSDYSGILWTIQKSGIILSLLIFILVLILICYVSIKKIIKIFFKG